MKDWFSSVSGWQAVYTWISLINNDALPHNKLDMAHSNCHDKLLWMLMND